MAVSRAIRKMVGFLAFQVWNEAVVNCLIQECGFGRQYLGPQLRAQTGRFAQDMGYGFKD